MGPDRIGHEANPALIEQHAQLGRDDEIAARSRNDLRWEVDRLQPFAQIMVLDLGLQAEDAQGARRGETQKRQTCGHVSLKADDEIGLADLGRTAEHEHSAGRQQPRRDEIGRHRARVIEQFTKGVGRYLRHRRRLGQSDQRRPIAIDMKAPQPIGFRLETLYWPAGP